MPNVSNVTTFVYTYVMFSCNEVVSRPGVSRLTYSASLVMVRRVAYDIILQIKRTSVLHMLYYLHSAIYLRAP